jgi:hypothetical protein
MAPLPDRPRSLVDVADWFLSVHDDLLDEGEEVEVIDEAIARDIIRRNYLSGDCQAFALALHDHLGLPIVALMGGLHVAVQCPDGTLMDYAGQTTLAKMGRRYGWTAPTVTPWTREDALAHLIGDEDNPEDPWSDLAIARFVRVTEDRWRLPAPVPRRQSRPGPRPG